MSDLIQGDCRDVLPTLPERSIQTVITSPPYFGLRDYGVDGQIGMEPTIDAYVDALIAVFRLVRRVLRDDGVLWLNLGDAYANDTKWGGQTSGKHAGRLHGDTGIGRRRHQTGLPSKSLMGMPWRVALALQDEGWVLRCDVVWEKPNGMCESVEDRPTRTHEYLFLLAKSSHYYYDADAIREPLRPKTLTTYGSKHRPQGNDAMGNVKSDNWGRTVEERKPRLKEDGTPAGANRRSIWRISSQKAIGNHYATFPEALVEPCILAGSSPRACPSCAAPWRRVQEPTGHVNKREAAHVPGNNATKTDSTGWAPTKHPTDQWRPTCTCPDNDGAGRCVVLDPFAGTFTVGRVALRYGRHAIGIELNPDYCELAEGRTNGVQIAMEAYL